MNPSNSRSAKSLPGEESEHYEDGATWHGTEQSARSHQSTGAIHLTRRELEVLTLICEGLPNKLISRRLQISAGTVKTHVANILRELGVTSRLQAAVLARQRGLVAESPLVARRRHSSGTRGTHC